MKAIKIFSLKKALSFLLVFTLIFSQNSMIVFADMLSKSTVKVSDKLDNKTNNERDKSNQNNDKNSSELTSNDFLSTENSNEKSNENESKNSNEIQREENDERIMFYVRGVVETVKKLRWVPSIVHCSGWISALAPLYIKKYYQTDPSINSSKVIYALFNETFEGFLNERFYEKLKLDGFTDDDLELIANNPVDYITLNKLAIKYSDGVIQATSSVNPELIEYAKSLGKPFMDYPGEENYIDAYAQFYQTI